MKNLSKSYNAADIMTAVTNEIPISTAETAVDEAEEVAMRVRKEVFCVINLFGTKLMLGNGKVNGPPQQTSG